MRLSETISTRDEPLIFAAFGPRISADRRSEGSVNLRLIRCEMRRSPDLLKSRSVHAKAI